MNTGNAEQFTCPNWRPGEVCNPHKIIAVWEKCLVSVLSATLVTAPPLINAFVARGSADLGPISSVVWVTAVIFVLAWAISILITVRSHEDHIFKYFLMSVGLPGFVSAIALTPQIF